ncbi:hypothetical protein RclHR1_11330005 [Rhizophagus clarus]|uniref:Uncharacterized protein n=1 Tax=Rhizophagus clarus TaxID=94130 RepID=A0A2Z6QIX7_9GLOM|nr:hypothetical protein RclHR1_11330005 [Rhizophagus clarus]
MSAGVYKIPNITYGLFAKIIEELGKVMRKVTITIKNKTPLILENPEIYFRFGNSPYSNLDITPVKNGEVPYARKNRWCVKVYDGYINNPSAELFFEMRENSHLGGDGKNLQR